MGQKVHPKALRLGVTQTWHSRWFSLFRGKTFQKYLREDANLRQFLQNTLKDAGIDRVDIERSPNVVTIIVHAARPGFIIGRAGVGIEELKKKILTTFFKDEKINLQLNILEVSKPALSAAIICKQMIADLEKRIPFRRVLKQTAERVHREDAKGVKIAIKGRLDGAEIARRESILLGSVPLHNLRADIDYAQGFARTTYGTIGVKIWIYRGEIFEKERA